MELYLIDIGVSDKTNKREFRNLEIDILTKVGYRLVYTPVLYFNNFIKPIYPNDGIKQLMDFLSYISYISNISSQYVPSKIAAACLFTAYICFLTIGEVNVTYNYIINEIDKYLKYKPNDYGLLSLKLLETVRSLPLDNQIVLDYSKPKHLNISGFAINYSPYVINKLMHIDSIHDILSSPDMDVDDV